MTLTVDPRRSPEDPVLGSLDTLRRSLRGFNVRLLEQDDFARAEETTRLLRDLKKIEDRYRELKSDSPQVSDTLDSEGGNSIEPEDSDYPRYHRTGNLIVKTGLTRGKTETYEQRLPRKQFNEIRDALVPLSQSGEIFEARDPLSQVSAPSYLVYLLLGLLSKQGVVENPTRGQYRFVHRLEKADFDQIWLSVPTEPT